MNADIDDVRAMTASRRSHLRRPIRQGDSPCVVVGWGCSCGAPISDYETHLSEVQLAVLGEAGERIAAVTVAGCDMNHLPPWEAPDTRMFTEAELAVAGALSTMPPFDAYHPAYALPFARAALEALGKWEPTDS